jgi:hypothetical protein
MDQERAITSAEKSVIIAGMMGSNMAERADLTEKELKIAYAQYNAYMGSIEESKKMLALKTKEQSIYK